MNCNRMTYERWQM